MKKSNCTVKVGIFFRRIKELVDYVAIVGVFYILLYQIQALRSFCKAICEYLKKWFLPIELSDIEELYFWFEKWFRIAIVLSIVGVIISALIRTINEKRMKNKSGESRFEKSLFRYLHDTAVPRCFFVTGQWGSGKSFEVKSFFDNYYNYTKTQVYRESCFGLSSRKELIDEINNIIEQSDKSFYAQIIKVLQYLPVIGEATIDNLYALSQLLCVPIDAIICGNRKPIMPEPVVIENARDRRLYAYYKRINEMLVA